MTIAILLGLFNSFGLVIFVLGLQGLVFLPLTLVYELWKRRFLRIVPEFNGRVTVIIPAYNEEGTIRATVTSVLASKYPSMEVIVVNDGSTDSTGSAISDLVDSGKIKYIDKPNGGKASALNAGIETATGEVVVFTDADSIFLPDTIHKMVRWFGDPGIDAVCGNDAPLHPETSIQKFLVVTTHIGTGFVRRALSLMRCLPIITGNLGAIRTQVLREIDGFIEVWGEDLEITFRLYKHRKRVVFDPDPKVIAECPGTIGGLWKQRVRWIRSYIKIALLHKDLFFRPSFYPFSFYLPINFLNMTVVPLLQLALLAIIPWAYMTGHLYFTDTVEVLTFLGVIFFFFIAVYSIVLDRDYADLKYIPFGLLILPLSYFYNAVVIYSWFKELGRAEERWEKVERRGVFVQAKRKWEFVLAALVLVVASSGLTYYYTAYVATPPPRVKASLDLALSTHFDAWGDWRQAMTNITDRPDVKLAKAVGVSAGRPEWTYFEWKGHEGDWSNHQANAKEDLLERATATFHRSGFKVAAFIDVFGPRYIKEHPGTAAVSYDGKVHNEQVAFFEMVEGGYGRIIIEMIEYLAANYDIDIIDLTEMPYYGYSYNLEDLRSFEKFTGRKDWPRDARGNVDRDDPAIWEWRSTLMELFIGKAASAAHKYGKELYVDVPVSWADFSQNGREAGLDYERVLKHADNIVIWNYFFLRAFGKVPRRELPG
jgi:cellulose synthase/poly-beta-1,6-N-acetylglucosamine synthase-like glycosyltransferase